MKLTIEARALASLLGEASRIAEGRSIPILGTVLLAADGETLSATCTNMDMLLSGRDAAAISRAGKLCVAAEPTARFVGSLPPGAQVEIDYTDNRVTFRSGRARASFSTRDADDFPLFSDRPAAANFTLSASDLSSLLGRVGFAMSGEVTRPSLNGVHLLVTGGATPTLRGEATDGHRLARVGLAVPEGAEAMPRTIIPRASVPAILRLVKDGEISIAVSGERLTVTFPGGWQLTTKLVDYTFPDTDRVMPQLSDTAMLVQRATTISAIKRVSIAAEDAGNRGGIIVLEAEAGELRLKGSRSSQNSSETGEAEEAIDVDYSGPSVRLGLNSRYLLDALGAFGSDEIEVHLGGDMKPALFRDPRDLSIEVVAVPLRV